MQLTRTCFSKDGARPQHSPPKGEKATDYGALGVTSRETGSATFVAHVTGSEPERKQERRTCEGFCLLVVSQVRQKLLSALPATYTPGVVSFKSRR